MIKDTWLPWQQPNAWKATQYHEWQVNKINTPDYPDSRQTIERLRNITSDMTYK